MQIEYKIERCRNATGMPKFLASWCAFWTRTHWEREIAFCWERENAFLWELMVRAETVTLQCAINKMLWSSTKESSSFFFISLSITSNCHMTSFGFCPLRNVVMQRSTSVKNLMNQLASNSDTRQRKKKKGADLFWTTLC